jgi:hypothetical protein
MAKHCPINELKTPKLSFKKLIFRRVHKTARSGYQLHGVCASTWNNSAPSEQIFMKFDT